MVHPKMLQPYVWYTLVKTVQKECSRIRSRIGVLEIQLHQEDQIQTFVLNDESRDKMRIITWRRKNWITKKIHNDPPLSLFASIVL